jgi:hypothetical protein
MEARTLWKQRKNGMTGFGYGRHYIFPLVFST